MSKTSQYFRYKTFGSLLSYLLATLFLGGGIALNSVEVWATASTKGTNEANEAHANKEAVLGSSSEQKMDHHSMQDASKASDTSAHSAQAEGAKVDGGDRDPAGVSHGSHVPLAKLFPTKEAFLKLSPLEKHFYRNMLGTTITMLESEAASKGEDYASRARGDQFEGAPWTMGSPPQLLNGAFFRMFGELGESVIADARSPKAGPCDPEGEFSFDTACYVGGLCIEKNEKTKKCSISATTNSCFIPGQKVRGFQCGPIFKKACINLKEAGRAISATCFNKSRSIVLSSSFQHSDSDVESAQKEISHFCDVATETDMKKGRYDGCAYAEKALKEQRRGLRKPSKASSNGVAIKQDLLKQNLLDEVLKDANFIGCPYLNGKGQFNPDSKESMEDYVKSVQEKIGSLFRTEEGSTRNSHVLCQDAHTLNWHRMTYWLSPYSFDETCEAYRANIEEFEGKSITTPAEKLNMARHVCLYQCIENGLSINEALSFRETATRDTKHCFQEKTPTSSRRTDDSSSSTP